MGIFSNFFKSQPLPEDEIEESENVMRKLQEQRQEATHEWVKSIQDPGSRMPASYTKVAIPPKPTIEDVDQREQEDGFVYTPPVEAMYTPFDEGDNVAAAVAARTTNKSSTDWVARIFKEFERQSDGFNASAQGTNLVLSIHQPQYTEETVAGGQYGELTKVRYFTGYVSTTFWGMLMHGHNDKIDVYIVPSEAILQMTLSDINQSGFSPFITIESLVKNGALEWHVGGATIVYEAIPNLAKELVGDLIKIASGKLKQEDLFAEPSGGLKLDPGAAQNLSQVMRVIKEDSEPAAASSSVATAVKQLSPQPAANPLASAVSFDAGESLVDALIKDLGALSRTTEDSALTDAEQDTMRDLLTAMRTLHGQVSTFVAQYKPKNR